VLRKESALKFWLLVLIKNADLQLSLMNIRHFYKHFFIIFVPAHSTNIWRNSCTKYSNKYFVGTSERFDSYVLIHSNTCSFRCWTDILAVIWPYWNSPFVFIFYKKIISQCSCIGTKGLSTKREQISHGINLVAASWPSVVGFIL
jgi:hypothetical protein